MSTYHPSTARQPPVTEQDVKREMEYWLSQMEPSDLLRIFADKFDEMSRRLPNKHRSELGYLADALKGLSGLMFSVWSQ
jgi:hypothetical protein